MSDEMETETMEEEKRPKMKTSSYAFILLWLLACLFILFPAVKIITVTNVDTPVERTYSKQAVKGFSVCLTESEETGRVRKFYTCGEGRNFVQEKIILEATGEELEGRKEGIAEIPLGNGDISDCMFEVNGEETFLASFFNTDTKLSVRISKISIYEFLMWKIKSSKNILK